MIYLIVSKLYIQIEGDAHLVLEEGKPGHFLTVKTNAPPSLICQTSGDKSKCTIIVRALLAEDTSDYLCPSTGAIRQVVIGGDAGRDLCGVEFTMDNWREEQQLWVKAKMDGLNDRDQNRSLEIGYQQTSPETVTEIQNIRNISVSLIPLFGLVFSIVTSQVYTQTMM